MLKTLGVIGGMGPEASAYFYTLLTRLCPAKTDQEHPDIYIMSCPQVPDRTAFLLGKSTESPLPGIQWAGEKLQDLGVSLLAIPCITAHCFYDEICAMFRVPVLNIPQIVSTELQRRSIDRIGLMATDGTIETGLLERELQAEVVLPQREGQAAVMQTIYGQIKAQKPVDMGRFYRVADELMAKGAQAVLLGCTELSLIDRDHNLDKRFIDPLHLSARAALEAIGVKGL